MEVTTTGGVQAVAIPAVRPERILRLIGGVDAGTCQSLAKDVARLGQESGEPMLLLIDSHGGGARAARTLITVLQLLPDAVTGLVLTRALSSAFEVLQACSPRLAFDSSRLGTHHSYLQGPTSFTDSIHARAYQDLVERDLKAQAEVWQREARLLAARTGLPPDEAAALLRQERILTAPEALSLGLLDGIVGPATGSSDPLQ
jgi:ATP-dependent protease ClpP protease subunit